MAFGNRFDPFRDMLSLQDSLVRAFDSTYGGRARAQPAEKEPVSYSFSPAVDVFEDTDGLQLYVELPGVELKDIDLAIEGNTLTLRGERKLERDAQKQSYHLVERTFGSFQRTFTLPPTVDTEHVAAESKDGVLHVRLPKKAESKPRQIKVQIDAGRTQGVPATKQ